jgi:hypothetical protein
MNDAITGEGPPSWQILITTIPHRHDTLLSLLASLDAQMQPGASALLCRDEEMAGYRPNIQGLMDAATAEYVSAIADDDEYSPDAIPRIMAALASRPDYVGFRQRFTENGVLRYPVSNSLANYGWNGCVPSEGGYYRALPADGFKLDLHYINPVRREYAQQVRFRGVACDTQWADDMRALGIVKTEVFIDAEIYYYNRNLADYISTPLGIFREDALQPLPSYSWLTVIEHPGPDGQLSDGSSISRLEPPALSASGTRQLGESSGYRRRTA